MNKEEFRIMIQDYFQDIEDIEDKIDRTRDNLINFIDGVAEQ